MFKRSISWIAVFLLLGACGPSEPKVLRLATTTSTDNSGLLDVILPDFEAQYDARVDVVAVGTGQAIALGEAGDADVILVHARSQEDAFVAAGHGPERLDVMYNDFVRVLTTAIVLETRRGNFSLALALGIILLGIAFLANLVLFRLQNR